MKRKKSAYKELKKMKTWIKGLISIGGGLGIYVGSAFLLMVLIDNKSLQLVFNICAGIMCGYIGAIIFRYLESEDET